MGLCWPRVLLPSLSAWPALSSSDDALEVLLLLEGASPTYFVLLKLGNLLVVSVHRQTSGICTRLYFKIGHSPLVV